MAMLSEDKLLNDFIREKGEEEKKGGADGTLPYERGGEGKGKDQQLI